MNNLTRRRMIMAPAGGVLPPAYQQVEYIQATGTQYFATPIYLSSTDVVKSKFIIDSIPDNNRALFGSQNISENTYFILILRNPITARVGTSSYQVTSSNYQTGLLYDITLTAGLYIENGIQYTFNVSSTTMTTTCNIFGRNQSGYVSYGFSGKIYSFEIVNKFNGIPCYRKSDNEAGMYDIVNNVFYTNSGTGTFIVGNDV